MRSPEIAYSVVLSLLGGLSLLVCFRLGPISMVQNVGTQPFDFPFPNDFCSRAARKSACLAAPSQMSRMVLAVLGDAVAIAWGSCAGEIGTAFFIVAVEAVNGRSDNSFAFSVNRCRSRRPLCGRVFVSRPLEAPKMR